jgi:hypothetical protein
MKKLLLLFILTFSTISSALAVHPVQNDYFDSWSTYYYKDKESSQTGNFLKWLQTTQTLESNPNAVQPTAAFLSIIFADNPTKVLNWIKIADFTGNTRKAIEVALWFAGKQVELKAFAKKDAAAYSKPAPKLSKIEVLSPIELDMMWGAFQASGKDVYVQKVIDALGSADVVTQEAAQWSLATNMKLHPFVRQIVQSEARIRIGVVKEKLDELVTYEEENLKP